MTRPTDGLVSVVVVTHQSASTIAPCIEHIVASTADVEVIVVDNASDDGTLALIRASATDSDRIRLVANPDNRGFGHACNQGAAIANGREVLFLNPDAFVASDTVGALAAHLRNDPSLGLVGCRVVDASGRPHGPQRRREPTSRRSLMSMTGLARLETRWPAFAGVEAIDADRLQADREALVDVDAVNGAAMMLPRTIFEHAGGFDEVFILHAEDLDLCRRVRDGGNRVALANDVEIVHIGGVSSRRRPVWVEWQKTRSLWRYFRKHESGAGVLTGSVVAVGLVARFAVKASGIAFSRLRRSGRQAAGSATRIPFR